MPTNFNTEDLNKKNEITRLAHGNDYELHANFVGTSEVGEPDLDFDLAGRTVVKVDEEGYPQPAALEEDELVTSFVRSEAWASWNPSEPVHRPVIDIDVPIRVIPSTTPGHSHLYIDVDMSERDLYALLEALSNVGVVEHGYASVSEARGYSAVRLPWVKKKETEAKKDVSTTNFEELFND